MSEALEKSLREIEARKSGQYEQRTQHKDEAGHPLFINRLIREDSPYLLQHAHNPVNWYNWGEEAFSAAVEEDKPVFLSIGYSTCHWCHVMEAESFDNVEIARLLNQSYVCIKLDREQFPDIDDYYMTGVQIISGQGGWPMSNFLLPDGRTFYAATYFPPAQFADLLNKITQVWNEQRMELEQGAERTAQGIEQVLQGRQEIRDIELQQVSKAADRMLEREDQQQGGLAGAPKFPQEPLLYYFLDGVSRERDLQKMQFLDRALTRMAEGGIYDQVAGGFHRYSTDSQWLVPHFEKMLYNQSQLSLLYLRAWCLTGNDFYLRVVRQTLDYVLREMQQPEGGFYSATDADSEEQEGLFFVWTLPELREILDPDEMSLVMELYAPSETGNFEGANILALSQSLASHRHGESFAELERRLDKLLDKLLTARQQRVAPLRDDKLIVAWSAAMASSLAWAGWELQEPRYLDAAKRAVDFIWENNYRAGNTLYRIFLNQEVSIAAQLEDYANLCEALLVLFDITGEFEYLQRATSLMKDMLQAFWNKESGGFYLGPQHAGGPDLVRSSSAADGATLSAIGVAVQCLALLHERRYPLNTLVGDEEIDYEKHLQQAIRATSTELDEFPPSHVTLLRALTHHIEGSVLPIRYGADGRLKIVARRISETVSHAPGSHAVLQLQLSTLAGFQLTTEGSDDPQLSAPVVELDAGEQHWEVENIEVENIEVENIEVERTDVDSPNVPSVPESTRVEDAGLFNEQLQLTVSLRRTDKVADACASSVGIGLRVQVCSETVCLQPESFRLRF